MCTCTSGLRLKSVLSFQNALNIVPLNPGVTEVTSISSNQFVVALTGSDKKFK